MKRLLGLFFAVVSVMTLCSCGEAVTAPNDEYEIQETIHSDADSENQIIDHAYASNENSDWPYNNKADESSAEELTGWTFLEGEGGWHQRVTDEHIANAEYLFDQGMDSALEAHCVLLYKDEARDFAFYCSFKSYQYEDWEEVLIVSGGKRTVAKGYGAWDRIDLRDVASACDLDGDGFEEIMIPVITGTGTGYSHSSFFVFDSSDDSVYDMLSVCGAEDIIYCEEEYNIVYLQDISAAIDTNDGTLIFMQGDDVKYTGNIKALIDSYSDIELNQVRWYECVSAEMNENDKLVLISAPCFWGDGFVGGTYVEPHDTENDVCNIIYELEYYKDGTFKCVSVSFE